MTRVHNFSAGPATLPEPVLERAREELLDFRGTGMSVMEMSHRDKVFIGVAAEAERRLRELLGVPDNYDVIFGQGGATLLFSTVPMNLLAERGVAGYVNTGAWSVKAIKAAAPMADVHVVASSEATGFDRVPDRDTWVLPEHLDYVHFTPNETIGGVEFHAIPAVGDTPLVADMSSNLLSRPIDVSRFGVIYAGAQKNVAIAGLTLVIVRRDLTGRAHAMTPPVLDWRAQADSGSMLNTPPTFAWYLAGLVFEWLESVGGLPGIEMMNRSKAGLLYDAIDGSNFYSSPVRVQDRSLMNVPFTLADESLDATFLEDAQAAGLMGLKGHRSVGGMRASIYNAMPKAGVQALVDFMREFERTRA